MTNSEKNYRNDFLFKRELKYLNQILDAIMKMDVYALYSLLDDEIDYEDIGKVKFIEKLNDRFNQHKTWGDSKLQLDFDNCNGCNCNQPVCKFIGNHSRNTFALYFEIKNEKINDIYHCNWYGNLKLN